MQISDNFKNYDFLFDSHAHLSSGGFEDIGEVIKRAKENCVEKIFDIGVDLESSKKTVELAAAWPSQAAAFVGIDPEIFEPGSEMFIGLGIGDKWFEEQYSNLFELISNNKENVEGIGETGMDFHHFRSESEEIRNKSIQQQERLFRTHLELAKEFKLPVSIHSRAAESYCLDVVKTFPEVTGIFHSYTGDYATSVKILDAGWGLGVNGIITFKNAEALRQVYRKILSKIPRLSHVAPQALDPKFFYQKGIFFETDSPYLAPEGKRGQQNEPANVKIIYDYFVEMLKN